MTRPLCAAAFSFVATSALAASHVVLVVWDGMRPDFVNQRFTPALTALASDGVRFQNHHSIYCTATDVNGTALATGVYPNRSGVFANVAFRPRRNARHGVDIGDLAAARAADLHAPTIGEIARAAGKKIALVGTKSVTALFDPQSDWTIATSREKHLTIFAAASNLTGLTSQVPTLLGPFLVEGNATSAQRNAYATRALSDVLWREGVPDLSVLWLNEPDLSEHNDAPGSPQALAAMKSSDEDLAAVLHALDQRHARETTDVFVVSDHGFSTIRRSIDVAKLLSDAGYHAFKELPESPQRGDILVVGNGGSVVFYVQEHDRETCARLVGWLQESDFAGAIFSRDQFDGTFPLRAIHLNTEDAADVVMSFRWSAEHNQFGVPGLVDADWNRKAGQGTHATLSPFDVHATFIAAGPDFRRGFEDKAPTANTDIAPTILYLLGVAPKTSFDGRIVREALRDSSGEEANVSRETMRSVKGDCEQELEISRIGNTTYFDSATTTCHSSAGERR